MARKKTTKSRRPPKTSCQKGGGWISALARVGKVARTAGRLGKKAGQYAYKNKRKIGKWALKEGTSAGMQLGSNLLLSAAMGNDEN